MRKPLWIELIASTILDSIAPPPKQGRVSIPTVLEMFDVPKRPSEGEGGS